LPELPIPVASHFYSFKFLRLSFFVQSLGKKSGDFSRRKESTTHDADKDLIAAAEGIISRPVPINPPLLIHIAKESPSLKACCC
jgi:hypothetical protein